MQVGTKVNLQPLNTQQPLHTALKLIEEQIKLLALNQDTSEFLIAVGDEKKNYYVQFMVDDNGEMYCEASGNKVLTDEAALDAKRIAQMAKLGWQNIPSDINFSVTLPIVTPEQIGKKCAELARETLLGPYKVSERNLWQIRNSNSLPPNDSGSTLKPSPPEPTPRPELAAQAALQLLEKLATQYSQEEFDNLIHIVGDNEKRYDIAFHFSDKDYIYCETSSNEVLDSKYELNENQLSQLEEIGWISDEKVYTWQKIHISTPEEAGRKCVELAQRTLLDIFKIPKTTAWLFDDGSAIHQSAPKRAWTDPLSNEPKKSDNGWCITSGSDVSITLLCASFEMAKEFQGLFHTSKYRKAVFKKQLIEAFMTRKVSCREIDSVLDSHSKLYHELVESLDQEKSINQNRTHHDDSLTSAAIESMNLPDSFKNLFSNRLRPDWSLFRPEFLKTPPNVLRHYLVHYNDKYGQILAEKRDPPPPLLTECIHHGLINVGSNISLDKIIDILRLSEINKSLGTSITRRANAVEALLADPSPLLRLQSALNLNIFREPSVFFSKDESDLFFREWGFYASIVDLIHSAIYHHDQPYSRHRWASASVERRKLRADTKKLKMRAIKIHEDYLNRKRLTTSMRMELAFSKRNSE